jgi:hypothetical protein
MRKSHRDRHALAARLLKDFRIGRRADAITYILVKIAGGFAHDRRRALRLRCALRAVALAAARKGMFLASKRASWPPDRNTPARMGATVRVAALVFGKIAGLTTINMVMTESARL